MKAPIAIISFNRPAYLKQVLSALIAQVPPEVLDRDVYLFQDGAINPFSGRVCASDDVILSNETTFRHFFPNGRLIKNDVNLGIALHFDKIENFLFIDRGYEAAIFLEDDFVIGELYLDILDKLLELALADKRIGYVSAIGDHRLSPHEQETRRSKYIMLKQNWAFGLTKRQWLKNKDLISEYMNYVRFVDYRDRPHAEIFKYYRSLGAAPLESSQDRMKFIATTTNKNLRLSTAPCYGKYIGEIGEHSSAESYKNSDFANGHVFREAPHIFESIDLIYDQILSEQWTHIRPSIPMLEGDESYLQLTSGSPDCAAMESGFHAPEDWGVWASCDVSVVKFMHNENLFDGRWKLTVEFRHYLGENRSNGQVSMTLNGIHIFSAPSSKYFQKFYIEIEKHSIEVTHIYELKIYSNPVTRPNSFHDNTDARELGVGIRIVRLSNVTQILL